MKNFIFLASALTLVILQVTAAPTRAEAEEEDAVEKELQRHHHATGSQVDDHSNQKDGVDQSLYDLTVGDVIYDVLLTLREHPEIVKQLIESEKAKLAEELAAYEVYRDTDTVGDDLAGYPAQQLSLASKSVQKKADQSGVPTGPDGVANIDDKRAEEVTNDAFTGKADDSESKEFHEFLENPTEGGIEDPMLNYEKSASADENKTTKGTETGSLLDRNDIYESGFGQYRSPYGLPFLNPIPLFRGFPVAGQVDGQAISSETNEIAGDNSQELQTQDNSANNEENLVKVHNGASRQRPLTHKFTDEDIVKM
ncbi:uncharacterized protein LOC128209696 [Mya arenaria]|uniref:uncharacterized protein LOC128209696 n=1 Tax=Mya arenaria TaxID=6604 RepID=UPI0022E710A1|nr:uncharacterized protein LOC128209696 [Mya arenaria]